ncbi:unnamed protein product [Symbiodinium sp. CCMP2592]|nr:unnamed protein product [Symbiodinium sp. CCMP2592]
MATEVCPRQKQLTSSQFLSLLAKVQQENAAGDLQVNEYVIYLDKSAGTKLGISIVHEDEQRHPLVGGGPAQQAARLLDRDLRRGNTTRMCCSSGRRRTLKKRIAHIAHTAQLSRVKVHTVQHLGARWALLGGSGEGACWGETGRSTVRPTKVMRVFWSSTRRR